MVPKLETLAIFLTLCLVALAATAFCAGNNAHPHIYMIVYHVLLPFLIVFAGAFVGCYIVNAYITCGKGGNDLDEDGYLDEED